MSKFLRRRWSISVVLLGLAVAAMELVYLVPMPAMMYRVLIVAGVVLLLLAGATFVYINANANSDAHAWWKDDDWTHWGGI